MIEDAGTQSTAGGSPRLPCFLLCCWPACCSLSDVFALAEGPYQFRGSTPAFSGGSALTSW